MKWRYPLLIFFGFWCPLLLAPDDGSLGQSETLPILLEVPGVENFYQEEIDVQPDGTGVVRFHASYGENLYLPKDTVDEIRDEIHIDKKALFQVERRNGGYSGCQLSERGNRILLRLPLNQSSTGEKVAYQVPKNAKAEVLVGYEMAMLTNAGFVNQSKYIPLEKAKTLPRFDPKELTGKNCILDLGSQQPPVAVHVKDTWQDFSPGLIRLLE